MAKSETSTAASDAKGFYPKNAQEVNFDNARKTAEINSAKDDETRVVGGDKEDYIQDRKTATEVINPVALADGTTTDDTRTLDLDGKEVK